MQKVFNLHPSNKTPNKQTISDLEQDSSTWEQKIFFWLLKTAQLDESFNFPLGKKNLQDFNVPEIIKHLRNGVILCTVINIIEPGCIKYIDQRPIEISYSENLTNYLKGCWKLGISSSDLFIFSDILKSKNIPHIFNNIWTLIRIAQNRPNWIGPILGSAPRSSFLVSTAKSPQRTDSEKLELQNLQVLLEQEQKKTLILEKRLTLLSLNPEQKFKKLNLENEQLKEQNKKLELKIRNLEIQHEEEKRKNQKVLNRDNNIKITSPLAIQTNRILENRQTVIEEEKKKEEKENTLEELTKIENLMKKFEEEQNLRKSLETEIQRNSLRLDESKINPIFGNSFTIYSTEQRKCDSIINDILRSRNVEDITLLEKTLDSENGIRFFIKNIQKSSKKLSSFYIIPKNFEKIVQLFEKSLSSLEKQKNIDIFSTIKILKIARLLHTRKEESPNIPIYLNDYLKKSNIWKNQQIWVEYFYIQIFKKQRQHFPNESKVDRNFFITLFCSFLLTMQDWGLEEEILDSFQKLIIQQNSFQIDDIDTLQVEIEMFLQGKKRIQSQKESSNISPPQQRAKSPQYISLKSAEAILNSQSKSPQSKNENSTGIFSKSPPKSPTNLGKFPIGSSKTLADKSKQPFLNPSSRLAQKNDTETVIKRGYLTKKGGKRRNWKLRFFILKLGSLSYKKNIREANVLHTITLKKCYLETCDKKQFCMALVTDLQGPEQGRIYYFACENNTELKEWTEAIKAAIISPPEGISVAQRASVKLQLDKPIQNKDNKDLNDLLNILDRQIESIENKPHISALQDDSSERRQTVKMSDKPTGPLKTYNAIFDYKANGPKEFSFVEGDQIVLWDKLSKSNWWKGHCVRTNECGFFPSNFVELKEEVGSQIFEALYDYTESEENELSFFQGDKITLITKNGSLNWWKGSSKGKSGFFPANFVKKI